MNPRKQKVILKQTVELSYIWILTYLVYHFFPAPINLVALLNGLFYSFYLHFIIPGQAEVAEEASRQTRQQVQEKSTFIHTFTHKELDELNKDERKALSEYKNLLSRLEFRLDKWSEVNDELARRAELAKQAQIDFRTISKVVYVMAVSIFVALATVWACYFLEI